MQPRSDLCGPETRFKTSLYNCWSFLLPTSISILIHKYLFPYIETTGLSLASFLRRPTFGLDRWQSVSWLTDNLTRWYLESQLIIDSFILYFLSNSMLWLRRWKSYTVENPGVTGFLGGCRRNPATWCLRCLYPGTAAYSGTIKTKQVDNQLSTTTPVPDKGRNESNFKVLVISAACWLIEILLQHQVLNVRRMLEEEAAR